MGIQPQNQIYEQYEAKLKRRKLMMLPLMFLIVCCLFLAFYPPLLLMIAPYMQMVKAGLFVIVILFVVVSFIDWRCPNCNHFLGKTWNPNFCVQCGTKFHD